MDRDVHWQDDHIVQQHERRAFQLERLLDLRLLDPRSDQEVDSPEKNIRQHQEEVFQLMLDQPEPLPASLLEKLGSALRRMPRTQ